MEKVFFDKHDLFQRLHERRKKISIEEFEDLYKCLIAFINNEMQNGTHLAIDLPYTGQIYLTEYASKSANRSTKRESTKQRLQNILRYCEETWGYNLLKVAPLHKKFGKMPEIEKKQDEVYYDTKKQT